MSATLKVKSPFSQEVVGEYPTDSFESVHQKISRLHAAQIKWRALPIAKRVEAVQAALNYFTQNKNMIATDISQQMGRPISQSPGEVGGLLERAQYLCSIAVETLSPLKLPEKPGFERSIVREPLGVIFVISAWNYPL